MCNAVAAERVRRSAPSKLTVVGALLFYLGLSILKMRGYALTGRFWAEEGAYFFPAIDAAPGLSGLGFLFHAHLDFAANTVIWVATLVDLRWAPLFSTWLAFLVPSLPVLLIVLLDTCKAP